MKLTLIFNSRLGFLTVLFLITHILFSQDYLSADSIINRIERQVKILPQEKIHVHNDKPIYISGEKIWLRAHLVDSYALKYDSTSIYIYGELINPLDSIVDRIKIRRDNDLYAGKFTLSEDYPAGTYSMRFYTKFMENMGDDYFFKKNIEIGGPFSAKYKTNLEYTYGNDNKKLDATLQFIDQKTEEVINPTNIAIAYRNEHLQGFSKDDFKKLSLNDEQKALFSLNIGKEPIKSIYIEYEYEGNFHNEFIPINAPKNDFHVDFFPEGGNFLSGIQMNISFKALYSDGLSSKVSGIICTEAGDTITSFNTIHKGMGIFPFIAQSGEKYVAICETDDGMKKTFNMPEVVDNGYGLAVQTSPELILISLLAANNENIPENMTLLIQSRGHIIYINQWDKDNQSIQLQRVHLPTGIIHCLLVDNDYTPISERLLFNYPPNYSPQISLENNKPEYEKRDKIVSNLTFSDSNGQPLNGNFSVSVTDNNDIEVDQSQSILTTMLLTSELKGYIENPSFYFQKSRLASYALDILMQTQGWRRYDIPKVLKGNIQHPTSMLEYCQMIQGSVKSGILLNQKGKNIPISMMALTDPPLMLSEVSNDDGNFMFRTDLPDSLSLVIKATTKNGGNRIELKLKEEKYPIVQMTTPKYPIEKKLFNSYFEKADQKYTMESGMRMINLKDIEVIGADMQKSKKRSRYSSGINTIYDADSFKKLGAYTLKDVLNRLSGVRIESDEVFIRANTNAATVYVNDMTNSDIISINPDVSEIESLEVIKDGSSAFLGAGGANGAVLIITKRGDVNISIPPLNVKKIRPLGYQSTAKFYSPKYETVAQKNDLAPDLRTTLYWNPYIEIVNGKAEILFYTADEASNYTMVLEGLSKDGRPLHLVQKIGATQ